MGSSITIGPSGPLTAGGVVFATGPASIATDAANFFWDNTNNFLGIGHNTPLYSLDIRQSATTVTTFFVGAPLASFSANSQSYMTGATAVANRLNPIGNFPTAFSIVMQLDNATVGLSAFTQGTLVEALNSAGAIAEAGAVYADAYTSGAGSVTRLVSFQSYQANDVGTTSNMHAFQCEGMDRYSGTLTNTFAFYSAGLDQGSNNYFLWYNGTVAGAGIWNVDNLGVMSYYNPGFTSYTAGAGNFERGVIRWTANVLEIGANAGGTGTLRAVNILGTSVNATAYRVGGVAGFNGTVAPPLTITVTNGIVTNVA
jgi:hypothetical protein